MVPAFRSQMIRGRSSANSSRGVAPGQQVQGGLEGGAGERGERRGPAHRGEPFLHIDGTERRGRHGLLGQDVQRVGRDAQPLDLAGEHPLHRDGRVDQILPGAWGTARPGRFRRPGARRGPPAAGRSPPTAAIPPAPPGPRRPCRCRAPGEEVATTQRSRPDLRSSSIRARWSLRTEPWWARASTGSAPAVLPACAIMWAGVRGRGGGRRPAAPDPAPAGTDSKSGAASRTRPAAAGGQGLAFGVDFVEPGGQPFGEAAGIGEHDGGLVGRHQVHDLLLHMRPDGRLRLQPRAGPESNGAGGALQIGHVLHRDRGP